MYYPINSGLCFGPIWVSHIPISHLPISPKSDHFAESAKSTTRNSHGGGKSATNLSRKASLFRRQNLLPISPSIFSLFYRERFMRLALKIFAIPISHFPISPTNDSITPTFVSTGTISPIPISLSVSFPISPTIDIGLKNQRDKF